MKIIEETEMDDLSQSERSIPTFEFTAGFGCFPPKNFLSVATSFGGERKIMTLGWVRLRIGLLRVRNLNEPNLNLTQPNLSQLNHEHTYASDCHWTSVQLVSSCLNASLQL